jgi:seryl-tRNA synthetase
LKQHVDVVEALNHERNELQTQLEDSVATKNELQSKLMTFLEEANRRENVSKASIEELKGQIADRDDNIVKWKKKLKDALWNSEENKDELKRLRDGAIVNKEMNEKVINDQLVDMKLKVENLEHELNTTKQAHELAEVRFLVPNNTLARRYTAEFLVSSHFFSSQNIY